MTMNSCLERGVYLDMPFDDYLAEPSLSASGIKALMISPLTFWTQFLNPNGVDDNTSAKSLGRALHKMLLEGYEAFQNSYAVEPKPEDYPGCLQGVEAIRKKCGELGLKKSGTLNEMSNRILEVDPECLLWPVIKSEFHESLIGGNQELISKDVHIQCLQAQKAIKANNAAKAALTGGLPEVSVFWEDEDGVPMKARFDYLKPKAIIDLKSFSNSNGVPVDKAVVNAVANYKYHVPGYLYTQAAKAAKTMITQGSVFGGDGSALHQFATDENDPRFFFVFLETGPAKNVLVREFIQSQPKVVSLLWESGKNKTERAINTWKSFMSKYGTDQPWRSNQPARAFLDEEFPAWVME